ncbi:alpha/beta fold hydrolase [Caenimonas terrae]|uniref:Alpha/beta fold hydrolase n=1 Tax=Caenimonas terrae TaxID=696074 RepID=A0ABW0NHH1_9BURK
MTKGRSRHVALLAGDRDPGICAAILVAAPGRPLGLFDPRVQDFLIHTMAIDPAREIARYGKPVLVVQGDRNLQVGMGDAILLTRACPAAELALVTDANHVLKRVPGSGRAANLASYADPSLPMADGVVDAIATFIFKHTVL